MNMRRKIKRSITLDHSKVSNMKFGNNKNILSLLTQNNIEDTISKLTNDIKEYQHYIKLLGPHHKFVENLDKKIIAAISDDDYNILQIILKKKKRTAEELFIIKFFLSTLKYLSSMIQIIDVDKILLSLSLYLKMERKPKHSILFRYGDKGKRFYIILSGDITILLLKETTVNITFKRYFFHLLMLRMMDENELVKKTIISNSKANHKYYMDPKIFDDYFDKIVNFINTHKNDQNEEEESVEESSEENDDKKRKLKQNKVIEYKRGLKALDYLCSNFDGGIGSKDYKFDLKEEPKKELFLVKRNKTIISGRKSSLNLEKEMPHITQSIKNFNFQNMDFNLFVEEKDRKEIVTYYLYLKDALVNIRKRKISKSDYIKNTYLNSYFSRSINKQDSEEDLESYVVYEYQEISKKSSGHTFGELALQHSDSKRTATVITNNDCIFGYLQKDDYENCLSEIEVRRRKTEVNFIMSFSIFDKTNWISFENRYFNYFSRIYYSYGDQLITQGENINQLFFIIKGKFQVKSTLSINDIYKLIRQKSNYSFEKIKLQLRHRLNEVTLSFCDNKDILGLDDICYDNTNISFANVYCISSKSLVFTLDKSIMNELVRKSSETSDNLKKVIKKRNNAMLDRLISLFNQLVKDIECDNLLDDGKNKSKKKKEIPKRNIKKDFLENNLFPAKKIISEKVIVKERKANSSYGYKIRKDSLLKFNSIMSQHESVNTPKLYIKTLSTIKEVNKSEKVDTKLENLYLPINTIIHKEYNNLFDWMKNKKFIIKNIDDYKINSKIVNSEQNFREFKTNTKNSSQNRSSKIYSLEKVKKNINLKLFVEQNNYKTNNLDRNENYERHKNKRSVTMNSFGDNADFLKNKENTKINKESNISCLKKILGVKYRNEEDEYITRYEKSLTKQLNKLKLLDKQKIKIQQFRDKINKKL